MKKQEKAMEYFENGYNCSQAVVMTYAKELNVKEDVIQSWKDFVGLFYLLKEINQMEWNSTWF